MRKWFYAGAVAGGFLVLGAAPAQADVVPAPAGDLLGSLTGGLDRAGPPDGSSLIPADLLGGGLLGGGLTPDGRTGAAGPQQESALFDGGVPLLGGLGGLLPANGSPHTLPATADDTPTGMPAGGTPVDPVLVDPPLVDPAPSLPAPTAPPSTVDPRPSGPAASGQTVDDPRPHEEPIDDEAAGPTRSFSAGGRPIAGEDEDFR